ncbi:MAG: hypothetical protein H6Q68_3731 [Firmicutes bacterium]|nr:hypothetical protein [Bacillota bacterium]
MENRELNLCEILGRIQVWAAPVIEGDIPHGDMPGDKVQIEDTHITKANQIFPVLIEQLSSKIKETKVKKVVVTVCGGSGVGKSEIASVLSFYLNSIGIGAYTLSGDNYPHRIPRYNDAERLRIFRESGIKGMVKNGEFSAERFAVLHNFQIKEEDANPVYMKEYPWFNSYLSSGKEALSSYLGSSKEIGFDGLTDIISQFKNGEEKIWLRRMGREDTELWYEEVDFSNINVLIIEWTHGNSSQFEGVDIPILLNSTPQETLVHRRSRNRDGATDSPFTMLVLSIEQQMLEQQASRAKIILSKNGELLNYNDYCSLMDKSRGEMV